MVFFFLQVDQIRKSYKERAKQFAQSSLKLTDGKTDEFEKIAVEICETFKTNKDVFKEELPYGITQDELNCIKRVAASYGFSFTTQTVKGNTKYYLTKKEYLSRNMI